MLHTVETVTHAWDLSRATEQQPSFDPQIVRAALEFTRSNTPAERPPGTPFASAVAVADDRPAIDQLAAYLGRTP